MTATIASFPATFGLAAFPGDVFRISERNSYFGAIHSEFPTLYTDIMRNGEWCDFAKGTPSELRYQLVKLDEPKPVAVSPLVAVHVSLLSQACTALRVGEPDLAYHLVVSSMRAGQRAPAADQDADVELRARIMRISIHELIVLTCLRLDDDATRAGKLARQISAVAMEEARLGYAAWATLPHDYSKDD